MGYEDSEDDTKYSSKEIENITNDLSKQLYKNTKLLKITHQFFVNIFNKFIVIFLIWV